MKKIISFLIVTLILLKLGTVLVYAENNPKKIRHITSSTLSEYISGIKVTYLSDSTTIKNSEVKLDSNEMLYIRKNVTLCLCDGATINGTVYIENGGKLLLTGGNLIISKSGMILSDGILSINKKASFTVKDGANVFVGKNGALRISSDNSLNFEELGTVICIGNTNSKSNNIGRKPIAAYIWDNNTIKAIKNPSNSLPKGSKEYNVNLVSSKKSQIIIFIFENGACIKTQKSNGYFIKIGNCLTSIIGMKIENGFSDKGYGRIYEINGIDYVYDMNGISDVLIDKNNIISDYEYLDNDVMINAFKNYSKNNYIGKFLDTDADMYLNSDSSILVIWKHTDENLPLDYLNSKKEILDKLYCAAILVSID